MIKFHPSLIILVVLWLLPIPMGVMVYLSEEAEEASRLRLAQRLGVHERMSHDEMIEYYDCIYVPVGTHVFDLLERVSQIDDVLVQPFSTDIPFQSHNIEYSHDPYPSPMTIYYNEFSFLDRDYMINKDRIVYDISEVSTYYGSETIHCAPNSPE